MTNIIFAPNNSPMLDERGYVTPLWASFFDQLVSVAGSSIVPIGAEVLFDGSVIPAGWLFCDGRELKRSEYRDLFGVIGTRYGEGDGTTTFNIPDRRGKFLRGATVPASVEYGGADSYTLTFANLPDANVEITDPGHRHTFTSLPVNLTINDPGHDHDFTTYDGAGVTSGAKTSPLSSASGTSDTDDATTGITIDPFTVSGETDNNSTGITARIAGESEAFSILPPYLSISFIIKY